MTTADKPPLVMDGEVIADALDEVRTRIAAAEAEQTEIERRIQTAREEERLLTRLIALRRGESSPDMPVAETTRDTSVRERRAEPMTDQGKHPAVEASVQDLAAAGRP